MRDSASATPPLHPAKGINKFNNYVKELFNYPILPNGTNIGGLKSGVWVIFYPFLGGRGIAVNLRSLKKVLQGGSIKANGF